ncbi:hypothetical protein ACTHEE_004494 [Vibrio parahaemolyticus]
MKELIEQLDKTLESCNSYHHYHYHYHHHHHHHHHHDEVVALL